MPKETFEKTISIVRKTKGSESSILSAVKMAHEHLRAHCAPYVPFDEQTWPSPMFKGDRLDEFRSEREAEARLASLVVALRSFPAQPWSPSLWDVLLHLFIDEASSYYQTLRVRNRLEKWPVVVAVLQIPLDLADSLVDTRGAGS